MITTIQINKSVKDALDKLKTNKQTYEQVILNLLEEFNKSKQSQEELLIEGCKEMAELNIKLTKEFEAIGECFDWEWEGDL